MTKIKLDVTMTQFRELHEVANRKGKRPVPIPKETLLALLRDHSKLYDFAKNEVEHG